MAQHLVVLVVFLPMILGVIGATAAGSNSVTTESLAAESGLRIETHTVTTPDGYILTLHRIPNPGRKPVFLMHGFLLSSSDYLVLKERSLGYLLHRAGFDVWLGNARGNNYSKQHVTLNADSGDGFWDFSWHEIGVVDLPAMIGYVSKKTGGQKIVYIGQCQGTTTFLVASSLVPGFNKFIESAQFLSTTAYLSHIGSPVARYAAPLVGDPSVEPPWEMIGKYEFKPTDEFKESIASTMCDKTLSNSILCYSPLFAFASFNEETVDPRILDDVLATNPSGSSTKQFQHFMQEILSAKFRQFDYGEAGNLMKYGQSQPPNYPIANIKVPIDVFILEHDALSAAEDVQQLIDELKSPVNVFRIPGEKFDHLSQLFNRNAPTQLYDTLIANIISRSEFIPKPKKNGLVNTVFKTVAKLL